VTQKSGNVMENAPRTRPILLIEDEEPVEMMVRRALKRMGEDAWLVWKQNGEDALAFLENCEVAPCVILLDIHMPVMDGFEFLKRAKLNDLLVDSSQGKIAEIPVVILSTVGTQEAQEKAKAMGVLQYFQKGETTDEYIEQLRIVSIYWNYMRQ
jgi:CheY-like chemotaxis protein